MQEYNYWKKVIKMLGTCVVFLILILFSNFLSTVNILFGSEVVLLFAGAIIPGIWGSTIELADNSNWKTSQRKLKRAGVLQDDTLIRISFAYLYRIKVDDRYFLILNNRSEKYQPVGGAYKFYEEEGEYLTRHIPAESDNRIPVDEVTKRDYRLLVKNKDLRRFVKRFNKTSCRENVNNLSREFEEEIFTTGILNKDTFGNLSYRYIGRHMTEVEYGRVFNHFELLLADILEVKLTEKQEELFRELMRLSSDKYCFASADTIKAHGVKYGTQELKDDIANHTPKILTENTDDLTNRNKIKDIITVRL
ncbi:SMODS-associated NUDIX domain-containing protein [Staphylococcus saprophyticus]|jgi:hypothetical protein|uniref:SMODS-associated NUDIX domain-containing protein n=1 Tax=Staphylococcus saprophyticus TaxID=29385 RepID=UPI0016433FCC|nr:hypothetical protein [Staphylococcus saprophyticus]HDH0866350.1 hypothetical protein [Staphylococcus aureus]MBC2920326.1 hypothetical protein [Staphylococcus saprophyticus]MBC2958237.1 hypothetical protein [Staphylococcus saprophyticus]MBC3008263.1 hypothetical protein [Staphylococcus saprophyticus]MBC3022646.1 hypothetical protein [Staphylococcus saprophyticus]